MNTDLSGKTETNCSKNTFIMETLISFCAYMMHSFNFRLFYLMFFILSDVFLFYIVNVISWLLKLSRHV